MDRIYWMKYRIQSDSSDESSADASVFILLILYILSKKSPPP